MDYPAWVQAVGSVAAIIVAGRTVELAARRARLERLYGADGIFRFCASTVRDAATKANDGLLRPQELKGFPSHRLEDCLKMLGTISGLLVEIGSEKLPQMTSDASEHVRASIAAMNAAKMASRTTNNVAEYANQLTDFATELETLSATLSSFAAGQKRRVQRWWLPFSS